MPAIVKVIHKWARVNDTDKEGVIVIDTTSTGPLSRDLSPFILGPCDLYNGMVAMNMENAWQFAKVYKQHTDANGDPNDAYWEWARNGWRDETAHRYPMGKGAVPQYSFWEGLKLGYIDARKQIYAPLYIEAVQRTRGWETLSLMYETANMIYLRDWDGWDMEKHGMRTLTEVLNNPRRKMGHAFVLKMLLENDAALNEVARR